jgi:DNA-directed RNA polymerase specialized sigma24 family protein
VRSLAHLRTLQPMQGRSLFSYFRTITLNLIRDHARRAAVRPSRDTLEGDEHAGKEPSPLEQAIGGEALERYEAALATLSDTDQQLIRAHLELVCDDEELAELFEKPTARAARVARARALARLAEAMKIGGARSAGAGG